MIEEDRAELLLVAIVQKLKELRQQNKLSHDRLAQKAGITRPAISHIEKGKRRPSLMVCLRLAQALDIELSDIIKSSEKNVPKKK